ncbi:MAG TPA: ABC transporter permease [Patescibacteria group bacterium]|nr:ABC transporter permease [Patescibacteria group bacterium]
MTKYVIRRIAQAIPVLFGISIVVYSILLAAPGGPTAKFAQNPRMTLEAKEAFKKAWGLDQPIPVQYCRWMGICNPDGQGLGVFVGPKGLPNFLPNALSGATNGVFHGDFGYSIDSGEPVMGRITRAALPTFILALFALVIWLSIAIVVGVVAAVKRYSLFDQLATIFAYVGFAMPTFWLGIMLIFLFSGPGLNILPAGGMTETRLSPPFGSDPYWAYFGKQPLAAIADIAKHLILPVITLVVVNIAGDSRFVRASMLEALSQDYVRTAKAKGLSNRSVTFKHALRNAMLPVLTNIGLEIPFLFTGALVTETIFSWPGIGKLTIDATRAFDYPILMGVLLITAILVVLANLIADLAYAFVDPRIKY